MINLGENLLSKFLELMSRKISESDLELTQLGKSLGLDLVSFASLRTSQEDGFVDKVRELALKRMYNLKDNYLKKNTFFYAGSIDFMVANPSKDKKKKFFLLETNGGSHRGLSILSKKQQAMLYDGYLIAIYNAIANHKSLGNKVFILVGVPVNDALIHEKVIMIEYFRKNLKNNNYSVKIFNFNNYDKNFKAEVVFLIADYNQISSSIYIHENWVMFNGEKINLLIGDGIARRIKDKNFTNLIKEDAQKLKTIIINLIYMITDDKSLTYLASYYSKSKLNKYNLKYLLFAKAFHEEDLIDKIDFLINKYKKAFIIKPSGGSGGAGIVSFSKNENLSSIRKKISQSKREFYEKFMESRNPFPYTIQEKADFSLIKWRGKKHTFDLRIYLAQNKKRIIPIGGLARISKGNFISGLNKQEFVVNLSGFDGQIEAERGLGFSKKNCKILNLTHEDLADMFCIGCTLFKSMVDNYRKIIHYSKWDDVLV